MIKMNKQFGFLAALLMVLTISLSVNTGHSEQSSDVEQMELKIRFEILVKENYELKNANFDLKKSLREQSDKVSRCSVAVSQATDILSNANEIIDTYKKTIKRLEKSNSHYKDRAYTAEDEVGCLRENIANGEKDNFCEPQTDLDRKL